MRRGALTWGIVLIVVGGLVLADNFGLLPANWWQLFWPALIILLGVRMVLGGAFGRGRNAAEHLSLPLDAAPTARVILRHGAGRLVVADGAAPGSLIDGDFAGGVEPVETRSSDQRTIELRASRDAWDRGWGRGDGLDWNVRLASAIPLAIDLYGGANDSRLDLSRLNVRGLRVETGASATYVTLPAAAGYTRVSVSTGAASVRLVVPEGVAARIVGRSGLGKLDISGRFPMSAGEWRSPDYDTAANKVDLDLEVGVGAIRVE